MNNENFCDRISQLVDYYGGGRNTNFANLINVTESNVRSWLNNTLPKVDIVEKISRNCEGLSLDWLVLGEGSMLKTSEKGVETASESGSNGTIEALKGIIKEQATEIATLRLMIQQMQAPPVGVQEAFTA